MLKKQIHNVAASALIVTLMLTVAGTSFASWQGDKQTNPEVQEKREEIHQTIESGDYEAFKSLLESNDHPHVEDMLENITEENFGRFQEAHQLMQEAREKMEAAQTIFEELGIEQKGHHKFKNKMMHKLNKTEEVTQ